MVHIKNAASAAAPSRSPPKILVVEDESIVAMDMECQLQEVGYAVCGICDNGTDAILQAWQERPSLILMDIVIKGKIDGIEAARQIERGLNIPVVFLTAYSDSQTVERAAKAAPYGYLTKPFQIKEVSATIEVALYKAALERQLRDSERWFAALLRCVGDSVIATDDRGLIRFMNPAAEALLGWSLADGIGRDSADVAPLEDTKGSPLEPPVRRALNQGTVTGIEFGTLLTRRNGEKIPIDDSAAPIKDEGGNTLGAVMVFRDVRDRLAMEEKLRQSEERFRNAFDFAPVGMALIGLDNRFLQVNGAFCKLLGCSEADLIGVDQSYFSYLRDSEQERNLMYEVLAEKATTVQFEKRYRNSKGKDIWTLVSVSLLKQSEKPLCYLCQINDLTERKDVEFQMARLAHTDVLTGLANRARLGDEIERQILLAKRYKQCLAVVFIDIDYFKQVNDSFGHDVGDQLLKAVAEKLKASVRETDIVARLGGDEFVVLLPDIHTTTEALFVTEKMRSEFAKPVHIAGQEMIITLSVGVSLFPEDASDARTLLRFADSALYHAKAEGRNNLQFYRSELTVRAEQRVKLTAGLRRAIEHQQLELYYQPIVTLNDRKLKSAEALIRWNHPELGLVLPDTFIPLAEEFGLIVPIGEWVIHQACQEAVRWSKDSDTSATVAVNVSARQFKSGNLIEIVNMALSSAGLDPARLCLEITEHLLLEDTEYNLEIIFQLKALGVQIAIDDFGIGYSSLSYIKHFRPTKLKIDRSLICNFTAESGDACIFRAVLAMAHSLNLCVIAEGVETADQHEFLQKEGSEGDMAQGFFYSHPLPATDFRNMFVDLAPVFRIP